MELTDALFGLPPSGCAPQGSNGFWPSQKQSEGTVWPMQPTQQPTQPQPPSCWPGQPNTPCWTGPHPSQPTQAQNWPSPQPQPTQPAPAHTCQPCWPVTQPQTPQYQPPQLPQYQPPQLPQYQPSQPPQHQPLPSLQPSQAPRPTPVPASSQVPSQPSQGLNPKPRWPFNPGQSGWPGQNPSFKPGANGWPFGPGQHPGSQSGWPAQDPAGFRPATQWTPIQTGNLNVPYNLDLKRGIYDKMMLTIMGKVKPNAKQFTVNFLRGNDIAFHLNPRFNDKGMQVVVRNTKVGECWGTEERHTQGGFPFMAGQSFEMRILITFEEFKVAVNGALLFDYKHRVRELNQIDRINVLDDVTLTYVSVDTIP